MLLFGQDISNPTYFSNFMCQYARSAPNVANAAQVAPGTAGTNYQASCGTENIAQQTGAPATIKGNKADATQCANQ